MTRSSEHVLSDRGNVCFFVFKLPGIRGVVMWLFGRRNRQEGERPGTILRVLIDADELCSITTPELPIEKQSVAELKSGHEHLRFLDSAGKARSFDLASVFAEDGRFLHLSVRVGPTFAVQPDCIVTKSRAENPQE